jgi:hypothetical protein
MDMVDRIDSVDGTDAAEGRKVGCSVAVHFPDVVEIPPDECASGLVVLHKSRNGLVQGVHGIGWQNAFDGEFRERAHAENVEQWQEDDPGKHLPEGMLAIQLDCRVSVDGAPTIYCFHASCAPAVVEANRRLRKEMGDGRWDIMLPGERAVRNGEVLQKDGTVKKRETITGTGKDLGRGGTRPYRGNG